MTTAALPSRMWRNYPRETLAVALLAAAGVALGGAAWSLPSVSGLSSDDTGAEAAPPAPPPLLVRGLAPQDALALNAGIPLDSGPNPAARPFSFGKTDPGAQARALECLTSAIYYEAGQETADGQRGVAQVVLNRVRHPAFPATVCGVVYQGSTRVTGCQFTFTCDGSLARRPIYDAWARASQVARAALNGYVHGPVGLATHYHANYVVPYWASSLAKNAVVGTHIFYRWSGGWGRPPAFAQRYAQSEPNAEALRIAALEAERSQPQVSTDVADAVDAIPGAEALPLTPDMRRDKVVAVRFKLAAREASDAVEHKPYVEKNPVSDTLRWTLSGGAPAADAKPLGKAVEPSKAPAVAGAAGDE